MTPPPPPPDPYPFASVEAAWFCTMRAPQPGQPGSAHWVNDVFRCMDTLYRRRRIDLLYARILRIWGLRGVAPSPTRTREKSDWRIWQEAMDRLEGPLRARGIIASVEGGAAD